MKNLIHIFLLIQILIFSDLTISCTTGPSSKSLIPDGIESITLLSATISPATITTKGSEIKIYFTNNDSISMTNLTPVVIIDTKTSTITERRLSKLEVNLQDNPYFIVRVSNPKDIYRPSSEGKLSGTGTIYIYLEYNFDKRVSNVISVYVTFE